MLYKGLLRMIYQLSLSTFRWIADLIPGVDNTYYIGSSAIGVKGIHISTDILLKGNGSELIIMNSGDGSYKSVDALAYKIQGQNLMQISNNNSFSLGNQTWIPKVPSLTTTTRDNLTTPANGMIIYNTTTGQLEGYDGAWKALHA